MSAWPRRHERCHRSRTRPIRVLIVDDHEVLASSLAMVLDAEDDITTAGVADDPRAGAGHDRHHRARRHPARPPDARRRRRRRHPRAPRRCDPSLGVVVLTASAADHVLLAAIEAGASGFLSKTRSLDEVTAAVRAAAAGESVISPEMLARLLPRLRQRQGRTRPTSSPSASARCWPWWPRACRTPPSPSGLVVSRAHGAQPHRQPLGQAGRPLQAGGALDRGAPGTPPGPVRRARPRRVPGPSSRSALPKSARRTHASGRASREPL